MCERFPHEFKLSIQILGVYFDYDELSRKRLILKRSCNLLYNTTKNANPLFLYEINNNASFHANPKPVQHTACIILLPSVFCVVL